MAKIKWQIILLSFIILTAGLTGCKTGETQQAAAETPGTSPKEKLTIMHVDYNQPGVSDYLKQAGEELGIEIELVEPPKNPDTRQALFSTLLASGDSSVDIFTLNDEMISEFKNKGYVEPLNDVFLPKDQINYPQEYILKMTMAGDKIYSLPYRLDVLILLVNERWVKQAGLTGIDSKEDLERFMLYDWGKGKYAYGGAWEKTYAYNEIGEFINLFGGNYYDFKNPRTLKAVEYMKKLVTDGSTDPDIMLDQYDQMNQKFMSDRYGMTFVFCGGLSVFTSAGVYGDDHIHMVNIPGMWNDATYVASWQYTLNHASKNKETAKRFIKYISEKDECIKYAEVTDSFPARTDIYDIESLNVTGFDEIKDYIKTTTLYPRPIPQNSLVYIEQFGELFQKYVLGELSLDEYALEAQNLIDQNFK